MTLICYSDSSSWHLCPLTRSIIPWADWNLEWQWGEKNESTLFPPLFSLAAGWCWEWLRFSKIRVSINSPSSVIPALNRALTPFPYLSPQAYELVKCFQIVPGPMCLRITCGSLHPATDQLESPSPLPSWVSHLLPAGTLPGEMVDGRESVSQGDRGHPYPTQKRRLRAQDTCSGVLCLLHSFSVKAMANCLRKVSHAFLETEYCMNFIMISICSWKKKNRISICPQVIWIECFWKQFFKKVLNIYVFVIASSSILNQILYMYFFINDHLNRNIQIYKHGQYIVLFQHT